MAHKLMFICLELYFVTPRFVICGKSDREDIEKENSAQAWFIS